MKSDQIKTYWPFLPRLAGFSTFFSRSPSPTFRSSSDPPLLCRVLRFLGSSLGSDSPRFLVIGVDRAMRGAMKLC